MKLLLKIFIIVAVLLPVYSFNLESLKTLAISKRDLVSKYSILYEENLVFEKVVSSDFYPKLNISYNRYQIDEASFSEIEKNGFYKGVLSWRLFSGFKSKYLLKAAKEDSEVRKIALKGIKEDIQLKVSLKYLLVFIRNAQLQVVNDSYLTLKKVYENSQYRHSLGLIKKSDLLQFKVDLNNAQILKKEAFFALKKNVLELSREVNNDLTFEELSFEEFTHLPQIDLKKDSEKIMMNNNSNLKTIKHLINKSSILIDVLKADNYPVLDFETSYRKYQNDLPDFLMDDGKEIKSQIILSYNLFDGFKDKHNVKRAKLQLETLKADYNELNNDLKITLKTYLLDFELSNDNVKVATSSVIQAEENLRLKSYKTFL